MLHFQKKDNVISIFYRTKNLQSKTVLLAAIFACAIHLVFWFVFSIASLKAPFSLAPLKPVSVATDLGPKLEVIKNDFLHPLEIPIQWPDFQFKNDDTMIPMTIETAHLPFLDLPSAKIPKLKLSQELKDFQVLQKIPSSLAKSSVRYEVQIDHSRGEIFWMASSNPRHKKSKEGERQLKKLRFQPTSGLITKGQIEVYFDD